MKNIKLVLFDLDGTLLDAYGAIIESFNYAMRKTDPWPRSMVFDSLDHAIACPADQCVDGYWVEVWRADSVGVGNPVWSASIAKWEVTPTGGSPAYQTPTKYPALSFLQANVPYVWTLQAHGQFLRTRSARSNPTPETFQVTITPVLDVRVQ